ncbi:hypothetical protein Tco_0536848 [Tanacetum coccineum]
MESSSLNLEDSELQLMHLKERQVHSKGMTWFKELKSHLETPYKKHLEDIHVTWAQLKKKQDKKATLQDLEGALDLQCMETALRFPLTPSKLVGDDVTVADLKKPMEDSTG